MGMVLFIFLLLMEIGLVILTFIKKREKARWLKDRVWFRLAETSVLLLLLVLPGVYNKFRFTAAFGLLLIRLLIAGIAYLAGRKKAEGTKRAAGLIVSCVLSVILIGGALMPAFIFTGYHGLPTTGDYAVKEMDVILVDASRLDTFENDGSYREVPVHFYYPDMDSVDGDGREGTFPLILFSHGAFGYYQSNSSTYLELASHGYVVASLDHPHHAFFSKDTDGKVVIVDQGVIQGAVDVTNGVITGREAYDLTHEWLDLRVEDQNFVLDTIEEAKDRRVLSDGWYLGKASEPEVLAILSIMDTERIGLMGHSLGGATSVAVGRQRDDIDAVIDIDGTMFGEETAYNDGDIQYEDSPYPIPVLEFQNESSHNEVVKMLNDGYSYSNAILMEHAVDGRTVMIHGTEHMDYTDLPLFSPMLGGMLGSGERDTAECMSITNSVILQFYDYYLKGSGELSIQEDY